MVLTNTEPLNCSVAITICCAILSMYISDNSIPVPSTAFCVSSQNIPSVCFKIFLFVIATIFFISNLFAQSTAESSNLLLPCLVIFLIAIAASSVIFVSTPV